MSFEVQVLGTGGVGWHWTMGIDENQIVVVLITIRGCFRYSLSGLLAQLEGPALDHGHLQDPNCSRMGSCRVSGRDRVSQHYHRIDFSCKNLAIRESALSKLHVLSVKPWVRLPFSRYLKE